MVTRDLPNLEQYDYDIFYYYNIYNDIEINILL